MDEIPLTFDRMPDSALEEAIETAGTEDRKSILYQQLLSEKGRRKYRLSSLKIYPSKLSDNDLDEWIDIFRQGEGEEAYLMYLRFFIEKEKRFSKKPVINRFEIMDFED